MTEPLNTYQKYKEYRIKWRDENKNIVNEQARNSYKIRVETDPEFRNILNERNQRNIKLRTTKEIKPIEINEDIINDERNKIGRPGKISEDIIKDEPKKMGRPRKYL
jgi:hypothetical protein